MSFFSIWKSTPNKPNQPMKLNMTVAQATTYIVKNRESLKDGEQYFTENQTTGEVDMMFSKRDTITPNKPMWLKGNRLVSTNPKSNPQKSMSDYGNPAWANGSTKKESKPKMMKPKTKSRGKWVGNMFKLSTSRLNQIKKTGTTKQKKLAIDIIKKRKK
jgi:hypothetical protein